ncbi:unnamed protein product [Effrenium voratum]|nr:unnamed protein product [Effrenium voratum]
MGAGASEPEREPACCCNDCAPGEFVEAPPPKSAAESLEQGFNGVKLAKVGAKAVAGLQNAAGVVMDALEDDGESEESGGKGRSDIKAEGHLWVQLESYMHHSHITVKLVGFCMAVALQVTSVMGIVGLFSADFEAFEYMHSVWNIAFGGLMILMDSRASWLGKMAPWQTALWQQAPILAKARGRALVHFYVGLINIAMADFLSFTIWTLIHLGMGGGLMLCGIIMLLNHHTYHCQRRGHTRALPTANDAQKALDHLKEEVLEVKTYIAANHCSVRIICFVVALALVVGSILGMINIFGALFSPFNYVIGVFNLFFAVAIVLVDGEPSWFKCCNCRVKMFQMFPCLASLPGRSLLHFYVGTINIVMLPGMPLDIIYIALGGTLCLCSLLMLFHHNYCLKIPAALHIGQ